MNHVRAHAASSALALPGKPERIKKGCQRPERARSKATKGWIEDYESIV
jgi:hypothetical protein